MLDGGGDADAVEKQELAAVEADAFGAAGHGGHDFFGDLNVDEQRDAAAVGGNGWQVELPAKLVGFFGAADFFGVDARAHGDARRQDHFAAFAIDDAGLAAASPVKHAFAGDNGGDFEGAREDRGVARAATDLCDEGLHRLLRQSDRVARREVVGDDDRVFADIFYGDHARAEGVEKAVADEVDVAAAFAEVGIAEGVKAGADLVDCSSDGPLGAFAVVDDVPTRALDQHRVGEHQEVRFKESAVFAGFFAQRDESIAGIGPGFFGAADFVDDAAVLDAVLRVLSFATIDEVDAAARNPRRDPNARQNLFRRRGRRRRHRGHSRR